MICDFVDIYNDRNPAAISLSNFHGKSQITDAIGDHPFIGRSYYRLSQVDYEGTTTFFDVITVFKEEAGQIDPYPNPTMGYLHVDVEPGKYIASLSDRNGLTVPSSITNVDIETGRLTLDLSNLEPGVYFMHITSKSTARRVIYKVVKR